MSGHLNTAFKENPVKFMTTHLIVVPESISGIVGVKNLEFTLYALHGECQAPRGGKALQVCKLGLYGQDGAPEKSGHSNEISAVYLPGNKKVDLIGGPDFLFTETMNGCSFALNDSHACHLKPGGKPQGRRDTINGYMGNASYKEVSGENYGIEELDGADFVTLVAWKSRGHWTLCYQGYDTNGQSVESGGYKLVLPVNDAGQNVTP